MNDYFEEFFNMMNPNFCDDYMEDIENDSIIQFWELCEDFFSQMGPQI